jgi:GNAT superfamily N-acetyltransferase
MTELHLRDARAEDQDAIRDVTLAAYQEYAAVMPPTPWERYRHSILETLADVRSAEQIIAEQAGAIVGTVLLYPAGTVMTTPASASVTLPSPEIRLLAVAPAARGQGVGAVLVRECLRRGRQAGSMAVTLHTTDMMQVAMSMYERMGFVRAPETDFEPAPGFVIKGYRYQFVDGSPSASV